MLMSLSNTGWRCTPSWKLIGITPPHRPQIHCSKDNRKFLVQMNCDVINPIFNFHFHLLIFVKKIRKRIRVIFELRFSNRICLEHFISILNGRGFELLYWIHRVNDCICFVWTMFVAYWYLNKNNNWLCDLRFYHHFWPYSFWI